MKNICFHLNWKSWVTVVMLLSLTFPALAEKITVRGTVVDDLGEALIGATVMEKMALLQAQQPTWTVNFVLNVDSKGTLVS